MLIGVPKEIKSQEFRVGLTPTCVKELGVHGHQVVVETGAGLGIGFADVDYLQAGASIAKQAADVFHTAKMIIKVKEPQPHECKLLKADQLLFTYLHLAPDPVQTDLLVKSGVTAIAYETIMDDQGRLPLLAPMSEVAGRLSIQAGSHCLEKNQGGSGTLLGGVSGVLPANVLVIGGGVVGLNAARMAMGLGAKVTIVDKNLSRLKEIDQQYSGTIATLYSTQDALETQLKAADLVVGAVLVPGAAAPKLISRDMLKLMKKGSVLVDVAIDQGGCFETSKATTHQNPIFEVEGVVHYCVANMPGAVARTATLALTHATLPFVIALANENVDALLNNQHFLKGLNVHKGQVTNAQVAYALDYAAVAPRQSLLDNPFMP